MEGGLRFTVTGLSPISVGCWKEKEPDRPVTPGRPSGGGGSTYRVTVERAAHGKVTYAPEDSTVTLTVAPDSGCGGGRFGPDDPITREQLVTILWRYVGQPAATEKELPFPDADRAGSYALDALRWAVEQGIISGKSGGVLDPKGLTTRAQTAQMLMNLLKDD